MEFRENGRGSSSSLVDDAEALHVTCRVIEVSEDVAIRRAVAYIPY